MIQKLKDIVKDLKEKWCKEAEWKNQEQRDKNKAANDSFGDCLKPVFEHIQRIFLCVALCYGGYLIWLYAGNLLFGKLANQWLGGIVMLASILLLIGNWIYSSFVSLFHIRCKITVFLFFAFFYLPFAFFNFSLFTAVTKDNFEKGLTTKISVEQCQQLFSGATLPSSAPSSAPTSPE